jgi:hypothetical protein
MDEQFSRVLAIAKRLQESVDRIWSAGTALKNAAWAVAALALAWFLIGAPSLARMSQVWQIVEAMNSKPETLTQIAEPGAVVATTDIPYQASRFTKRGKWLHYEGQFRVGEHLCASLATWGDGGTINVGLPDGYLAEASNAPGNFRPDTSANGCSRIPNVAKIPDPNGRQEMASKQFAELVTARSGKLAAKGAFAFYAIAILFAFWMRAQMYRHRNPLRLTAVQEVYAGFAVREGNFEYSGRRLFRVNSDGFRIKLKRWHFDGNSGEFFSITNRIGKKVIFDTTPYGKRFVKHAKSVWKKAGIGIVAAIAALVSVALWGMAFDFHSGPAGIYFTLICAAALTIFAVVMFFLLITNWHLKAIGPEPLPRAVPEFGTQQPHGSRDDEGTI